MFIHLALDKLNSELKKHGSSLLVKHGNPGNVWKELLSEYNVACVYVNHDYEPYARERDASVEKLLKERRIEFHTYKDQVIFEKADVVKDDGTPYTVFTPYMNKWKSAMEKNSFLSFPTEKYFSNFSKIKLPAIPALKSIGFEKTTEEFPPSFPALSIIKKYEKQRDIPSIDGTTKISVHLRFGTVSVRKLMKFAWPLSEKWSNELIWREFYMMILWHFPHVANHAFKRQYETLPWRKDEDNFQLWCKGMTGYPIVDAGMRQLNATGFMHNRLRMITSMFLTKYLLINWQWGEAYFAQKLLDFELSSNNGGWQWSAGTGVDAAPYFRIFNMDEQTKRFDPDHTYIKYWVPEYRSPSYPKPVVDYTFARKRCLEFFKQHKDTGV